MLNQYLYVEKYCEKRYNSLDIKWGIFMNDIELLNQVALSKVKMSKEDKTRFFMRSVMAGLYLGAAMILSYSLGALLSKNYPEFGKIAVASTFGIGLVAIVFLGAELFTGNCLTIIIPVYDGKIKFREVLPSWGICFFGNMIGMALIGFLFIKSGSMNTILLEYLKPLCDAKLTFTPLELLIKGILCNFIVCIAAYTGIKVKDDVVRMIMILFFVTAFVLPGFEHCIANMGFFAMCLTEYGLSVDLVQVVIHLFISTIGNIIGGAVFVGFPVYMIFRK